MDIFSHHKRRCCNDPLKNIMNFNLDILMKKIIVDLIFMYVDDEGALDKLCF